MSKKKKKNAKAAKQQKNIRSNIQASNIEKSKAEAVAKETGSVADTISNADEQKKSAAESAAPSKKKINPVPAANNASDSHHIMHPAVSYIYILVLFVLLVAVFILKLMDDRALKDVRHENEQLKAAMITASENLTQLSQENTEQKKQLEALSLALNARTEIAETQKKEEEESSVPELYPVKGDTLVVTPATAAGAEDPEDDLLLRFTMNEGSYAIAAGSGIIEIMSDDGDGFVNIVIDHGNGYKTSYTGEGISLKEAGDEIKRGDAVMIFTGDGNELTYSVSLNGKKVDPVSVMNIDG